MNCDPATPATINSTSDPVANPQSLADIVANLKQRRANLLNALINESTRPLLDTSFNGESVNRSSWRNNIQQQIDAIDAMLARYDPYELTLVQF